MTSVEFENARVGIPSQNELVLYRLDQVENSIKEIKHGVDKLGEKLSKKIELFTEIQRESFAKFILTERRVTEMEAGFSEGKTETREINRRIDEVDKRARWAGWKIAGLLGGTAGIYATIQLLYYVGIF